MATTLPNFKIFVKNLLQGVPEAGNLIYKYNPFFNLKIKNPETYKDLTSLRLNANKAGLSIESPIEMDIEESYDGSANIVLNDKKNPLKIINSRFYLTDSKHYEIGDRKGNLDTNIYTEDNFKVEASLIKSVNSIVNIDLVGVFEGGKMPVGNYTFYIKLADSDGNESDFIAESGKIICHIGNVNQPQYIRGGQLNEDSGKSIKLTIKNVDMAYTYINVYYTKTTGTDQEQVNTAYRIQDKFRIKELNTPITITGYEVHEEISLDDINIQLTEFNSTKSLENCQNISFVGNVSKNYELYKKLENLSLFITPELVNKESIGNLTTSYQDTVDKKNGFEYYNVNNIYYRLGYWDQEIYRFGIVYILNDYTLSPVFNIRGVKELSPNTQWAEFSNSHSDYYKNTVRNITFNIQEDNIIEHTKGLENNKGIFKINHDVVTDKTNNIFDGNNGIRPIGIRMKFHADLITNPLEGLPQYTKGFFIVRQKRIPTILAQAVGISTTRHGNLPVIKSNNNYIIDSFLTPDGKKKPMLGHSVFELNGSEVVNNALLCPEAALRTEIFNTYFNSAEYSLIKSKYQPSSRQFNKLGANSNQYGLDKLTNVGNSSFAINAGLLLIEPEIELTRNNKYTFSSKSGDAIVSYKTTDVKYGDYSDPTNTIDVLKYNNSTSKVRGVFNTYIGVDYKNIEQSTYYDIYQKGYNFKNDWRDYFKLRANDSSPFFPVSDRISWNEVELKNPVNGESMTVSKAFYRGDCYISTYTHRMNWNFQDPELPTNTRIVDTYTWYKHWRVSKRASAIVKENGELESASETLSYNKLMPLYTYKGKNIVSNLYDDSSIENDIGNIITPEDKGYKKYSENNGTFGYDKLNRPDINAVGLGQWVTFKVCSNVNLAMRDVDLTRPSEEAVFKMKRSFYPLQSMEKSISLPESKVINNGISKTIGDKYYFDIGDIPFIKESFSTRIHYSNVLQQSTFVNGNRTFFSKNYQDYSMEYGALVKLVEWYGNLIAVMEHGILMIPVNERAMMKNESGENVYINTDIVLPKNPRVLSNTYGSIWSDSITKTSRYLYGIDTVAKKIWRTNGETFELISDLKIQKFLNDNINLKESDTDNRIGVSSVKTHYNAFKQDISFVFKFQTRKWHLCWNEILEKWVTRYSWFPEFSENINNIFYTFANNNVHTSAGNYLYKHGFAGTMEEKGIIKPSHWYGEQHPFEFEFVVADAQGVQKIFNNLKIISNKVEPNSIIYEITGDGFEWSDQKTDIINLNGMDPELENYLLKGLGSPFSNIF